MANKSPRSTTRRWSERKTAYLDNALNVPASYRIITEPSDEYIRSEIEVSRAEATQVRPPRSVGERFSLRWLVLNHAGKNQLLRGIDHGIVHMTSFPPTESLTGRNEADRPYYDVLFLTGELELTAVTATEELEAGDKFSLGRVIGLTVVTQAQEYPVWTPS